LDSYPAIIVFELPAVKNALAPVKWEEAFMISNKSKETIPALYQTIRMWRAIPPTPDYIALGCVGMLIWTPSEAIPIDPSPEVADRFRAVHKSALTAASAGVTREYRCEGNEVIFAVDDRYWYADTALLAKQDCYKLDPKNVIEEFNRVLAHQT
jgi:hypothetical protein